MLDSIIFRIEKINYGNKSKDPIENIKFYSQNLELANSVDADSFWGLQKPCKFE